MDYSLISLTGNELNNSTQLRRSPSMTYVNKLCKHKGRLLLTINRGAFSFLFRKHLLEAIENYNYNNTNRTQPKTEPDLTSSVGQQILPMC